MTAATVGLVRPYGDATGDGMVQLSFTLPVPHSKRAEGAALQKAQALYLWNAEKRIFISYEDPESLRVKCRYIREQNLAGAMFWEYYSDPSGVLVRTLADELLMLK